eukprot:CAMPEP_0184020964 /NCGR_PEP_ID=MMETSP0954-20121128/9649_1 /TAXON_ID=627963 /ORGANISM="Aplanochytrium sp, Strain PBS07" /LENGTH=396 /DNA_ID=CAMNT_0026302899 /DNA_START=349 /DNA_END=1539 /DNA_ORIENTATION=+
MMFVGMLLALPIYVLTQYLNKSKNKKQLSGDGSEYVRLEENTAVGDSNGAQNDTNSVQSAGPFSLSTIAVLAIPSTFDLVATALANIGLAMISVSVYQLMKCTVIIFVAILKSRFLGIKLDGFMWCGVAINMVAVCLVASTTFFPSGDSQPDDDDHGTTGSPELGVLFIVLSCLVQSGQYVYEEKVMDESAMNIDPLVVVGFEGFWGLLFSLTIVLPAAAYLPGDDCVVNGSSKCVYENTQDTFNMMSESSLIVILTTTYVLVITVYNVSAIYVTFLLDSVWHAILDNFRPIGVWMIQLILFQLLNGEFGEEWVTASWLQLFGLIVLLVGTAVYNGNIRLPGFIYDSDRMNEFNSANLSTSPFLRSPGSRINISTVDRLGIERSENNERIRSTSFQ